MDFSIFLTSDIFSSRRLHERSIWICWCVSTNRKQGTTYFLIVYLMIIAPRLDHWLQFIYLPWDGFLPYWFHCRSPHMLLVCIHSMKYGFTESEEHKIDFFYTCINVPEKYDDVAMLFTSSNIQKYWFPPFPPSILIPTSTHCIATPAFASTPSIKTYWSMLLLLRY